MSTTKPCRSCGSTARTRSRRRAFEYLLVGLRPYRCLTCQRRFYLPWGTPAEAPARYIEPSNSKASAPAQSRPALPQSRPTPAAARPWYLIQDLPPRKVSAKRP